MKQFSWRSVALRGLVLLTALVCNLPVRGQQTLGSINGTVLDPSGAAVPGAVVTVTDSAINVTQTTTTQKTGFYQVFNLPVGTYDVKAGHEGFETTELKKISVQEARAITVNVTLKIGQQSESVEVTANPLLNATDTTNGYTLDSAQIELTPLATGSFTQLAVLSPGVNAELLANLDSNSGLGNQPIWANGQRDTSNTFQVNGVDATNLFNGKSSSGSNSQRYNFNTGGGSTSSTSAAGSSYVGGASPVGTSVYDSIGNSLPSPPPEFLQELRVNTSMYDAQQGATSGAQIDANTATGTNKWHGGAYGTFANNALNAAPFFFNQQYQLSTVGVGSLPESMANPALHRWSTGATVGGPLLKDKVFVFLAYQHRYNSDAATGMSQMTVPAGLGPDRSANGILAAGASWNNGTALKGTLDPIAESLLQATLPDGSLLVPSNQSPSQPVQFGVPNVTLLGTSLVTADQATASVDYDLSKADRFSVKYYYQNDPVSKPYGYSQTGGFPVGQDNHSQVGAIDNTIAIGSRLNWEQRVGYDRMGSYASYHQTLTNGSGGDAAFGIGTGNLEYNQGLLPGLLVKDFGVDSLASDQPGMKIGPYSSFVNMGFEQNRLNPSTNVIFAMGKHTIVAGGGYSYTQLNIDNNRNGFAQVESTNFGDFLMDYKKTHNVSSANILESIDTQSNRNNADRYYRSNEISGYLQDKWQALPNVSITAGVRYDYHGGMTEKYGNMFNFDPKLYNVTGTATSGFTVNNAGFVIAGNNKYDPTPGVSDSTLDGRQWGISPRVGFAWSPKKNRGSVVFRGGGGMYFDRGELFTYLSQPAGSGNGGPFGVTESAPLASFVQAEESVNKSTLANPLGSAFNSSTYIAPSSNPGNITKLLQNQLNTMTGQSQYFGPNCGGVDSQEGYLDCTPTLNFGAYDKNNVLPYTINYTLNMQWQPTNDLAVTIGYTGNRGRHSVIPVPFNEPGIATGSNPIWGETATYGFEVLNQNSTSDGYDYDPIATEPWNTATGGNTDFRAPYVGYNPNAALWKTVGNSAYDALEAHLEKRLSNNFQVGASYTWSHSLDEQSDIGLFFTGTNPNDLKNSWASSDFDRTNVFSANFLVNSPKLVKDGSPAAFLANDWHLTGIAVLQSGEPYSLYEFYGAVGSIYVGNYPNLMNPVLGIKNPANPKSALTGNKGALRGSDGSYIPAIDPSQISIKYVAPGTDGVPSATSPGANPNDPLDVYETDFAPGERNLFRQAMQKRVDLSIRKSFHVTEKIGLQYELNIFNLTNTTSLDVPMDQGQIRQNSACSASATQYAIANDYNCQPGTYYYVNYGQIVTSNLPADQQSAKANLDQIPYTTGLGKGLAVPTLTPLNTGTCVQVYAVSGGCPNNSANFGSVLGTIGGSRAFTMGMHLTF